MGQHGLCVSLACLLWTVLSVGLVPSIPQAFISKSGLASLGNYWAAGQSFIAVYNPTVTGQGHSQETFTPVRGTTASVMGAPVRRIVQYLSCF